jgi:hypothetical protein
LPLHESHCTFTVDVSGPMNWQALGHIFTTSFGHPFGSFQPHRLHALSMNSQRINR